jgi:chromosome partitioning protein
VRTIAVVNQKGGSAKTTTTVNLAAALSEAGHRVLVIDMDPQGSATSWLGVVDADDGVIEAISGHAELVDLVTETTVPGVELVPGSFDLSRSRRDQEIAIALGFIRAMERLPPRWDLVLVDSAASLGYLGIAPLSACREAIIPVEAHALALGGLTTLMDTIDQVKERVNPNLRLTAVLACRVNHTLHARAVVEGLRQRFPRACLVSQIRESIRLAEAPSFHLPINLYAPESSGTADYRAAAAELIAMGADPSRPENPPG